MIEQPDKVVEELCQVLVRLASPAQAQIDYLQHLGVAPLADELALEFHDLYLLVPQLAAQRVLAHQQRKAVDAVSRKLDGMSTCQDTRLWMEDALRSHPDWVEVRRLAAIAAKAIRSSRRGEA
jgi:hypothetical protein